MPPRISRFIKQLLGVDSAPTTARRRAIPRVDVPSGPDAEFGRAESETVFARLRDAGGLDGFPILFGYLSRKDEARRLEAYSLLRKILSTASGASLWRLDAMCRERTSMERDSSWRHFRLEDLIPEGIGPEEKVWGYALASFHPNGYLREKAVTALAMIRTGGEIPFLLLRLNDWVDEVRAITESSMNARLDKADGDALIGLLKAYPILKRLRAAGRRSHHSMLERIGRLIAVDAKALRSGLESSDLETRRFCFESALTQDTMGLETLQEAMLREPQGLLRLYVLRKLEERLTFPQAGGFINRLLKDPFSPVKRHALDIRCKHALKESGDVLREMIFSMNSGVRQTARHYMQQAGGEPPAAWYRKALAGSDGKALVGVLRGLGEVGERQDAERLHPFLKHERTMVVRAAIRSLAALQASYLATLLSPFILDLRPGVSLEATISLKTRTSGLNPEKLNAARKASPLPHVRKNILTLLFAIGYWESLPYILEVSAQGLASEDPGAKAVENVRAEKQMAEKALIKWIVRSNSYFVQPGQGLRAKCRESLARFGHALNGKTRKALEFILR